MSRSIQCLIALVAAGGVLLMGLPEADAARKASLADSRLIQDTEDIYLFPQVGVEYSQQLKLDYGPATSAGSGLALLGDENFTIGLGVFRGDLIDRYQYFPHAASDQGRLGNITNPILEEEGLAPGPHTMADLFASADLGAASVGARLSFGSGGSLTMLDTNERIIHTQNFGALTAGFSLVGDFRLDLSLTAELALGRHDDESQPEQEDVRQGEGNAFMIGASTRGYMPMQEGIELGFLADIHFNTDRWTTMPHNPDVGQTGVGNSFSLLGGAGPVYTIDEGTQLAGYGVLGYMRNTFDPAAHDADQPGGYDSRSVLPGFHLAADIELLEWLFFRTGVQYNFALETDGSYDVSDGASRGDTFERSRISQFGWRTGLGIEMGQFQLDGVFQDGFITGGPDFLGGNADGMFTMVSGSYHF